jgi:hypothetical protein
MRDPPMREVTPRDDVLAARPRVTFVALPRTVAVRPVALLLEPMRPLEDPEVLPVARPRLPICALSGSADAAPTSAAKAMRAAVFMRRS